MGLREKLFTRFRLGNMPDDRADLPITSRKDEIVTQAESSDMSSYAIGQLHEFRTLATDRQTMYSAYDEMKTDAVIAAALELYADDATQKDEQGRIIWVESDDENITKAGNRLLDIFEIPERAWKHIYQACLYGDYYLKLYRNDEDEDKDDEEFFQQNLHIVNDKEVYKGHVNIPNYEEYVEDVEDPAVMFDLRKRGKTAGFIEVFKESFANANQHLGLMINNTYSFTLRDILVYRPDRFVHIMVGENITRNPETIELDFGNGTSVSYNVAKGKSVLQDVYPIQKELELLEDTLLLNRLTRSSLIRLLEVELGDMPKKAVNDYLRRFKQLIEQHVSLDKDNGNYKSFNAPGPIDNVIYIPVRNGKGSVTVNNLGGDVNVRDIVDIDYFNNKRAGALKIPRSYLGDSSADSTGFDNGGTLTRLDIRYARTIERIQTAYIRAITTLLNLFFVDKKLDYVNKFKVKMTSPSTQENLERNEMINGNIDLISNIMDLTNSLGGDTQKKILIHLISNVLHMPEISAIIEEDTTAEEEIDIEGGGGEFGAPTFGSRESSPGDTVDMTASFEREETGGNEGGEEIGGVEGGFTASDFAGFEDEI